MSSHHHAEQFAYPEVDAQHPQHDTPDEIREEVLRRVGVFINEMVIRRTDGVLPSAMTIAVRLVVLNAVLYPDQFRSLNEYAKQLGCSRAWLSTVAGSFLASIGMKASWQRLEARDIYAERARGVHAGTWKATSENGKWERRKLREQRMQKSSTSESLTCKTPGCKKSLTNGAQA